MLKSKSVLGTWAHLPLQSSVHSIWKAAEHGHPYLPLERPMLQEGGRSGFKTYSLPSHSSSSCLSNQDYKRQSESCSAAIDLHSNTGQKLAPSSYVSAHMHTVFFWVSRDTEWPEESEGKGMYLQYHLPFSCSEKQEEILEARQICHIFCFQQFL